MPTARSYAASGVELFCLQQKPAIAAKCSGNFGVAGGSECVATVAKRNSCNKVIARNGVRWDNPPPRPSSSSGQQRASPARLSSRFPGNILFPLIVSCLRFVWRPGKILATQVGTAAARALFVGIHASLASRLKPGACPLPNVATTRRTHLDEHEHPRIRRSRTVRF